MFGAARNAYVYSELKSLVQANALNPGKKYILTDYVTKYRQPYTNRLAVADVTKDGINAAGGPPSGTVEKLVLTAISENTFDIQCSSLEWPDDIVFYRFDDDICEDGLTERNGFIQRRIDTRNNVDIPHDWRTMLWARFKADPAAWDVNTTSSRGSYYRCRGALYLALISGLKDRAVVSEDDSFFRFVCSENDYIWSGLSKIVLDTNTYAERYTFNASIDLTLTAPTRNPTISPKDVVIRGDSEGLGDNVFMFASNLYRPYQIYAAPGFFSNTFAFHCVECTFETGFSNNIFLLGCRNNTFGSCAQANLCI